MNAEVPRISQPTVKPLIDKRLLGIWKSDGARTVKEWRFKPGVSQKNRKIVRGIFGKLVTLYRRHTFTWWMDGLVFSDRYDVLGSDEISVAIRSSDPILGRPIYQIVFEGRNRYYLFFGENREWFRRLKKMPKFSKKPVSLKKEMNNPVVRHVIAAGDAAIEKMRRRKRKSAKVNLTR